MNTCIRCGTLTYNIYSICDNCKPEPIYKRYTCNTCGILTSRFISTCSNCREVEKPFRNTSLYMYNGFAKEIMAMYKFKRVLSIGYLFLEEIITLLNTEYSGYTICPVPTSALKRRLKGWYQLDFICKELKRMGYPVKNLLGKHISRTQKKLKREERTNNSIGRFYLKSVSTPSKVLILDDVYTTGATVNSCIHVLKSRVKTISSLTLYRD